ncbi:B12-binding domain-containing radical SAM protein [Thermodesulfobacteriota bacterium]
MKILLLNPPFKHKLGRFSREQRSPAITKSGTFYYPMWLCYATAMLEDAGYECFLIDAPALQKSFEDIFDEIKDRRFQLIIVNTSTPSILNDCQIAQELKKHFNAFTVLVGTHPSALPEESLKIVPGIDAVARGEYETTLLELADCLSNGVTPNFEVLKKIDGLSFSTTGNIYNNNDRALNNDLDSFPFVSTIYKKYLNYTNYFYSHSKYPIVTIITGRGCPHRCVYCVYPQVFSGRKLRYRSVSNVVDEIEYILENFTDVKEIMFEDDTLTINKRRCIEFAEEIIRRNVKFIWSANSRCDVDLETMQTLKNAGARLFCIGVESGVQKILDNMKKNLKVERIRQFFKDAKKAGILIHGCFLVGNPGETKATLENTLEFAKELNPDTAQFFPIMVYPGTEAYNWAKENGYLTTQNFEEWLTSDGLHNCIVSRPGLSAKDLVDFCDRARKEFYLRPKYILSKGLQSLKDPYEFKRLMKGALTLSKHIFSEN